MQRLYEPIKREKKVDNHCESWKQKVKQVSRKKLKPETEAEESSEAELEADDDLSNDQSFGRRGSFAKSNDSSCKCQSSEIDACCKPGCSKRMPCVSCTKGGCRAVVPDRPSRRRGCTCGKSDQSRGQNQSQNQNSKFKTRSKSEGRAKTACILIPETCSDKPKRNSNKRSKSAVRNQKGDGKSSAESSEHEIAFKAERGRPKSSCRKLDTCSFNNCNSVKFKEKCEMIEDSAASGKFSEVESEICFQSQDKSAARNLGRNFTTSGKSPKNPCGRSNNENPAPPSKKLTKTRNQHRDGQRNRRDFCGSGQNSAAESEDEGQKRAKQSVRKSSKAPKRDLCRSVMNNLSPCRTSNAGQNDNQRSKQKETNSNKQVAEKSSNEDNRTDAEADESCDIQDLCESQVVNGMTLMLPTNYATPQCHAVGTTGWSADVNCQCNNQNCSTYQRSYPVPPSAKRF